MNESNKNGKLTPFKRHKREEGNSYTPKPNEPTSKGHLKNYQDMAKRKKF